MWLLTAPADGRGCALQPLSTVHNSSTALMPRPGEVLIYGSQLEATKTSCSHFTHKASRSSRARHLFSLHQHILKPKPSCSALFWARNVSLSLQGLPLLWWAFAVGELGNPWAASMYGKLAQKGIASVSCRILKAPSHYIGLLEGSKSIDP